MRNATITLISTFGGWIGLMGMEHGVGAILQGSISPAHWMYPSWPESKFFAILGGEPAITVIPNLLVTGIAAMILSLAYCVCAVFLIHRRGVGWGMMGLAILMLPFGGGVFPPVLGLMIGAVEVGIHRSLARQKKHFSTRWLSRLWPWAFSACVICWLGMVPGVPALNYFWGVDDPRLICILLIGMFVTLILTVISGYARDSQRKAGLLDLRFDVE